MRDNQATLGRMSDVLQANLADRVKYADDHPNDPTALVIREQLPEIYRLLAECMASLRKSETDPAEKARLKPLIDRLVEPGTLGTGW